MESSPPKSVFLNVVIHMLRSVCCLGDHYDVMIPNYSGWVVGFLGFFWSFISFEIIN